MGFYDLSKEERKKRIEDMHSAIKEDLSSGSLDTILDFASDKDTYIRKNCYTILGRLYLAKEENSDLRKQVRKTLAILLASEDELVRQTAVYAFGEIGKTEAEPALCYLEQALEDSHHKVRNAVIGALKQMGQKNPVPTLEFIKKHLHHPDPEVRREMVHGMELRGRTHPEDVLPLLRELQHEEKKRVRDMVVHVLSQVSYKKGCLEKVVTELRNWENRELVEAALEETKKIHRNYAKFCAVPPEEAEEYIKRARLKTGDALRYK